MEVLVPTAKASVAHFAVLHRGILAVLRFPIHLPILVVSTREEQMFVPCPT
jgi:hypothetical protein